MERKKQGDRPDHHRHKPSGGKRRLVRLLIIILVLVTAQVVHHLYQDEEKALRTQVRGFVSGRFPDETARLKASYGIERFTDDTAAPGRDPQPANVVLVHGLDDPGRVWMNLAPRLIREGFQVWIMSYPNDQPITESARLFRDEMEGLRKKGVVSVDVVAHSMGGLVTREMLTSPGLAFQEKKRAGSVPNIGRFIMVGTPNHGSQLARFRLLAEVRDQFVSLLQHKYHWLRSLVDGAGEAGIDLLPGSRFLETLNQRPPPDEVEMLVIAGMLAPWQAHDMEDKIESAQERVAEKEHDMLERLSVHLNTMADGIGDGLVTVDSARLPGVPLRIVTGSHISIIRNLTQDNPREPPAIPMILKRLSRPRGVGDS